MIEREMGYRGSKSVFQDHSQNEITVKEQRVDSSYCKSYNSIQLRCTLMGFERNYQIKILSKKLKLNKLFFSTLNNKPKLDPFFITGFIDAEGSFISIISG
jgi:hypothetical protein